MTGGQRPVPAAPQPVQRRTRLRAFAAPLAGLLLGLAALPSSARAPENSPLPRLRPVLAQPALPDATPSVEAAAQALPPLSPAAPSEPGLPGDPMAGTALAAMYWPGLHAPKTSPAPLHRPEGDSPDAGYGAGRPEVGSAAVRPMPGQILRARDMALERVPRPKWRPESLAPRTAPVAGPLVEVAAAAPAASRLAVLTSRIPLPRPADLARRAARASEARIQPVAAIRAPVDPAPRGARGAICGIAGLQGTAISTIAAGACGVENPVRVTAVDGITLSTPATMDCATATALTSWIRGTVVPVVGRTGGGVARIDVAGSYSCRPRNNQKGARISEHGRGKAIDITAIVLKNGAAMSVLRGWNDRSHGPLLQAMHRGACGTFGTVLGPNANAFHRDHFHFDTASYRSGSYCR